MTVCVEGGLDGERRGLPMPDPDKRLQQLEEQVQAVIAALEEIRQGLPKPAPEPARDRAVKRWGLLAPVALIAAWVWQWRRAAVLSLAGTATTAVVWAVPTPVTDHAEPTRTRTAHVHPAVTVTHPTTGTPSSGRPPARTAGRPGAGHTHRRTVHRQARPTTRSPRPSVSVPVTSLPPGTPTVAAPHVQPSCVKVRVPGLLRLRLVCR